MHLRQLGTKGTKGLVTDRNANIMIIFRSTTKKIRLRGGGASETRELFCKFRGLICIVKGMSK